MTQVRQVSTVEMAQPEAFDRIADVWEASVRATHHFLAEADIRRFRPIVREQFLPHAIVHCIRDENGDVIAFSGVEADKLEALFVHPSWFGCGAGKRLAEHAIRTLGVTRVDVNEQNPDAVGFYRRLGFEIAERSPLDGMGNPFPILHMVLKT